MFKKVDIATTIVALFCLSIVFSSYLLEYQAGLQPCPLCILQRYLFIALTVTFALAVFISSLTWRSIIYAITFTFTLLGAFFAGRQVWLQHLPEDSVPNCGPDLAYMLQSFPLSKTWELIFQGAEDCSSIEWSFLTLSLAEWSLLFFIILAGFTLYRWLLNPFRQFTN